MLHFFLYFAFAETIVVEARIGVGLWPTVLRIGAASTAAVVGGAGRDSVCVCV